MVTTSLAANQASQHAGKASGADTTAARRRIWIISDDLSGPPDEGVKKFTLAMAATLRCRHDVELISTDGAGDGAEIRLIPTSKTFLGRSLFEALREERPEIVIYASRRSATLFTFLRARLLKLYCPTAEVVLLGLQTRRHRRWQQAVVRRIRPDLVLVQSDDNRDYLERLGCRASLVPSGVDVDTFRPVDATRRLELRDRYGLSPDLPVVLHVGHLQEGRGIRDLIPLAASGQCQVLLVTSTSTLRQTPLATELRIAGVRLLTDYLPRIEEVYQLSDCYVFPVRTTDNAIEAPLSVLEALACDLPVVTTRFGGLPRLFEGVSHPGLVFIDSVEDLTREALRLARSGQWGTRELALPFSWDAAVEVALAEVFSVPTPTKRREP